MLPNDVPTRIRCADAHKAEGRSKRSGKELGLCKILENGETQPPTGSREERKIGWGVSGRGESMSQSIL